MNTPHHTMIKRSVFLFLVVSLLLATSSSCGSGVGGPTPTNTITSIPPTFMPTLPLTATFTPLPKATNTVDANTWTGIGPWVNISTIALDPMTPTIIYAGTGGGGVFKSTNGGGNWSAVNSGLDNSPDFEVWDLAIDPVTTTTIYAGTTGGVFKSMNGGENWSGVNNGLIDTDISCLVFDPATPAILYVVTRSGGVFKSTNGGESWSVTNTGLTDNNPAISLGIDPVTPSILYLGTYDGGVFKSTNGGGDWIAINTGLGNTYDNPIDQLIINPATSTTLYAVTRYHGIFKSTNGGQNWIAFDTGLELNNANNPTLLIDPIMPTTLYIGTFFGQIFKSTDGGKNWHTYGTGLNKNPIIDMAVDPLMPTILYVGTYGGGVFTNQVNKAFASLPMPSLTAPPSAPTYSPLSTTPSPAENISSLPTEMLYEKPTLVPLEIPFKVSGTLNYRKQIQLPENSRVIVLWTVTAVYPDYGYVFGEGTIDFSNNTFDIEFDEPPPFEALNWLASDALGVGTVIITTDQTLESGKILQENFSTADIQGASGQYGIIYVNGNFETLEMADWINKFNQGYSAGKGIEIPNSVFDGFEPIDPTTIEIIIDDFENIEFVNWT